MKGLGYLDYIRYRAAYSLLSDASRYYLGWLWWLLEPLMLITVLSFVFTYLLPSRGDGFILVVAVGVVAWLWFANCVANAVDSIHQARGVLSQIAVPKYVFPLVPIVAATMKSCITFALLLTVVGLFEGVNENWTLIPLIALAQFLLILGVAPLAALMTAFVPDIRFVVQSMLQLMMFCSGVFYDLSRLSNEFRELLSLNPMGFLIDQYRAVLLRGTAVEFSGLILVVAFALLMVVISAGLFVHFDQRITRKVVG